MARKITFTLALLVLATLFTGASFANVIPTQITFGPSNVGGLISIGSSSVSFAGISGLAYQSVAAGTFSLSNANVPFSNNNSPYTFGPNSQAFSVQIGTDSLTGLLDLQALFINSTFGFFAGKFEITSSTPGFVATGFSAGEVADVDFVTYKGKLSSGELLPVPEPGTIALVGSGLLAAAGMLRRKF